MKKRRSRWKICSLNFSVSQNSPFMIVSARGYVHETTVGECLADEIFMKCPPINRTLNGTIKGRYQTNNLISFNQTVIKRESIKSWLAKERSHNLHERFHLTEHGRRCWLLFVSWIYELLPPHLFHLLRE